MIPAVSGGAYEAARRRAAFLDRSDRGRIIVTGADRATYLQGLLTNDITALEAGDGCYAAYLTPQGRMITDLLVYELGDALLITLNGSVKDGVLAKFDQFIFSEDVHLGDVTGTFAQVAVVGPEAGATVEGILQGSPADVLQQLGPHGNLRARFESRPAIVTRIGDVGEPGFELFVEREQREQLVSALAAAGAAALDEGSAAALRIEGGVPEFRRDMDEETIPLEAGIEDRAISFSKGCYVGQEVIIRVMHRGHGRVARKLVGFAMSGDSAPHPGAVVRAGGRDVGHVTSSALSPALAQPIALGYVQRDFVEPGTAVDVEGVSGVVAALPFVARSG